MKPLWDNIEPGEIVTHSIANQNVLVTQSSNLDHLNGAAKTSSLRRYPSSLYSKINHKVVLEVPLQYGFYSDRNVAPGLSKGWRVRQMSRLSMNSTFPILTNVPVTRCQTNTQTKDSFPQFLQHVTCQVSASTAIRGRTGYSTGSVQLQYRHMHKNEPHGSSAVRSQSNRWITTLTTGVGVQQSEYGKGDIPPFSSGGNGSKSLSNTASVLPFPVVHLGCSTSFTQKESSNGTSLTANMNCPKFGKVVLPVSVSNQQRIKLKVDRSNNITRSLDVRTQCTTIFDYSTLSSRLEIPTVSTTVSFSPASKTKSASLSNVDGNDSRRMMRYWSVLLGINKQADVWKPVLGVSMTLQLPKLLRILWKTVKNRVNSNLLEVSLQWKGSASWLMSGWWIQKQMTSSNEVNPQPRRKIRQIGLGVTVNHDARPRSSLSAQAVSSSPLSALSWIFTWTEGDFTLRIPILLSGISANAVWIHQGLQIFYLSILSSLIQDVVSEVIGPAVVLEEDSKAEKSDDFISQQQNARREALVQQKMMERPAKIRTALEVERNGLVIRRAIFYIHYPDNDSPNSDFVESFSVSPPTLKNADFLDVTVPLQFWLSPSESRLFLYGKRSSMLGFYDLSEYTKSRSSSNTTSSKIASTSSDRTANGYTLEKKSFWYRFLSFCFLESMEPSEFSQKTTHNNWSLPSNKLWIRYDFGGQSFEITVNDTEDIVIPSQRANLILL